MPAPASPRRGATTPPSYVDLNPILAAIADQPETSDYTSVQDRIRARQAQHHAAALLAQSDAADLTPTLRHAAETARAAGPEAGVWVAPIERASAGNGTAPAISATADRPPGTRRPSTKNNLRVAINPPANAENRPHRAGICVLGEDDSRALPAFLGFLFQAFSSRLSLVIP